MHTEKTAVAAVVFVPLMDRLQLVTLMDSTLAVPTTNGVDLLMLTASVEVALTIVPQGGLTEMTTDAVGTTGHQTERLQSVIPMESTLAVPIKTGVEILQLTVSAVDVTTIV